MRVRGTSDMAQRMAADAKIYQLVREDLPIIDLFAPRWNFGTLAKVAGFAPVADGMVRLNGVRFAR